MTRRLIVIMGPSGCGKSLIGAGLAEALDAPMLEGDDFHPAANIAIMAAGIALTDAHRASWLDRIGAAVDRAEGGNVVLACSALTPYVQKRLRDMSAHTVRFFLLAAPREELLVRIDARSDHFMPASLLDSQLGALVVPDDALTFDACQSPEAIVDAMLTALDD